MIKNSIQSWDGHSRKEIEEYIKRRLESAASEVAERFNELLKDAPQSLDTLKEIADKIDTLYTKPETGIPATDLAEGVIPTISTDITTDGDSDTKTASPKAVKTYVDESIPAALSAIESEIEAVGRGEYVTAWDGASTPVVADIPAGVSVTYNTTSYTGELAASDSTMGKIYLVSTGTTDEYDRYVTVRSGSVDSYTYSWSSIGSTSIQLSDYATKAEVSQLGQEVDKTIIRTKNLFDPQYLVSIANWTDEGDGVFSGTPITLYNNFYKNNSYYPIADSFKENTQYRISIDALNTQSGLTGNGISAFIRYTDNSVATLFTIPNSTSAWASFSGVTAANKTIQEFCFNVGSEYNRTWKLRKIQIAEATEDSSFLPYYTAVDSVTRNVLAQSLSGVKHSLDFSSFSVGTTNASKSFASNIPIGASVDLFLFPNEGNRNIYEVRFFNGSTQKSSIRCCGFTKLNYTNSSDAAIDNIKIYVLRFDVVMPSPFEVYVIPHGEGNVSAETQYAQNGVDKEGRFFSGVRQILDYRGSSVGSTYQGKRLMNLSIPVNAGFKVYVNGVDGDANQYYFSFYSGETRIATAQGTGYGGKRVISFSNTFGSEITTVEMTIVSVSVTTSYDVLVIIDGEKDVALELDLLEDKLSWLPDYLAVPYYFSSQLDTKTASIRTAMLNAGKNGSTFIFITDVHWPDNAKNSPALINYLLQRLPITDVFFGGDAFNGGASATQVGYLEDFGKKMHEVAPRFFSIFGNHENNLNDGGTGFDGDYFYTLLLSYADYQVVPGDYDNYYFDNAKTKTRFIILDTGQGGDNHTTEQSAWLSSVLSDMGVGYHAIILLHMAYGTATDLTNGTMSPTMAAAASVADSFNAENNGKKVEAFISGHLHADANKVTSGGIPIILTDCDARQTASGNPQTAGTVNEQAFDVITVDYSGKIVCTRIGRGSDREITY